MKKALFIVAIVAFALVLVSCATSHYLSDFDVVRPGMTEADILNLLGKPNTTGYKDGILIYTYNNVMPSFWSDDYCVYEIQFNDGKVSSYGQTSYQHSTETYVYIDSSSSK